MQPRDHIVELAIPEVEVSIDCTPIGQPYEEHNARPDDDIVRRAAEEILERHYDELVDLCADRYVEACAESRAAVYADRYYSDTTYP